MILSRSKLLFLYIFTIDFFVCYPYNKTVENIIGGAARLRWSRAELRNLMRVIPP